MSQLNESEKITAFYASLLALTEVGLGSALHALHLPFTGQFLSLNQIAILSTATAIHPQRTASFSISAIAALLKSLSPIGKKLTPMLALSVQGLLFTCSILIFGKNSFGRSVGAIFSSLWGFIQPALLYSLIFGKNIWEAIEQVNAQFLPEGWLVQLLIASVVVKAALAVAIAIFSPHIPLSFFQKLSLKAQAMQPACTFNKPSVKRALWLSIKDLFLPSFLFSFTLVLFLFYSTKNSGESLSFALLRPLAVGYLFSLLVRLVPMEKLLTFLEKRKEGKNYGPFQRTLLATLQIVQKTHTSH